MITSGLNPETIDKYQQVSKVFRVRAGGRFRVFQKGFCLGAIPVAAMKGLTCSLLSLLKSTPAVLY